MYSLAHSAIFTATTVHQAQQLALAPLQGAATRRI